MPKFVLIQTYPYRFPGSKSIRCASDDVQTVEALSLEAAVSHLQEFCPVPLSSSGHAKQGVITYTIEEVQEEEEEA